MHNNAPHHSCSPSYTEQKFSYTLYGSFALLVDIDMVASLAGKAWQ